MVAEANELRAILNGIAKSELHEEVQKLYKNKLTLLIKLFDFTAVAYKDAQEILRKIDQRVHNEFAYFSRAQNSILKLSSENKYNFEFLLAVDDALSAVRHLLNDIVDLIVLHAESESDRIDSISKYSSIDAIQDNYEEIRDLLISIDDLISETRGIRGVLRIESYIDIIDSGKYSKIVSYCKRLPNLERQMKKKRGEEFREGIRTLATVVGVFVAIFVAGIAYLKYQSDESSKAHAETNVLKQK